MQQIRQQTTETRNRAAQVVARPALHLVRPIAPVPRFPRWLHLVDRVHRADRSAEALLTDALVLLIAGLAVGVGTPAMTLVAATLAFLYMARCYVERGPLETQGLLWHPSAFAGPYALVMLALVAAAPRFGAERGEVVAYAIAGAAGLLALRAATWATLVVARHNGVGLRPTLVVGDGAVARTVSKKLADNPGSGLRPVGILSPSGLDLGEGAGFAARPDDLPPVVRRHGVTQLVVVPEGNHDLGITECLEQCSGLDVQVAMLPPLADLFLHPGHVAQVAGLPLLPLGKLCLGQPMTSQPGKRLFDVALSSVLLLLAMPIMAATAFAVWFEDRGPVFYKQRRVGRHGELFEMLKFRSMVNGADRLVVDLRDQNMTDGLLFKVVDDPRVTKVGNVIRKLSIDELPQLWNVLRGDMSLVGPRPLPRDPDEFGALDGMRHSALPGITGYWQLSGGNDLTYQEMVKLDLAYIQSWSLWLDVRLLLRTIPALVYRRTPY